MNLILNLLQPPQFDDEDRQRIANIEYQLLLVLICAALLVTILTFALRILLSFYVAFSCVVIILGCLWLIRKHHLVFVSYLIPLTLVAATTAVLAFENQRVHDYTILLYPLAIILSGLLVGRKASITFTILIIVCLGIMFIAERNGWIAQAIFNPTQFTDLILISIYIAMTGFLVYVAINIINDNLSQLQELNSRLQQSEANYRLLFEETPDAIFITDREGLIRMVNSGAASMLGYTKQEIIGKRPQDFIAPEDLERQKPTQLSSLRKGDTFHHERLLVRKNGTKIHTFTSSTALTDGRFQFLATDISDRIRAEQSIQILNQQLEQRVAERTSDLETANAQLAVELAERQKIEKSIRVTLTRTETLYGIAHALIATTDLPQLLTTIVDQMVYSLSADEGLLITFDLKKRKVLQFVRSGVGLEDIRDVSFEELWEGLSGWVMRTLQPAISPNGVSDPRESEKARQRRIADQRGSILVVPLHYRGKTLGTLTALNRLDQPDFSEMDVELMIAIANQASIAIENANLYEDLQAHAHELEFTNRELESFAYSVSHDLRAPLRAITSFSQIISQEHGSELGEETWEYFDRIIQSAWRMNELIEALLSFSRMTRSEISKTNLNLSAIAEDIRFELQQNDPRRTLEVSIAPGMKAYADRELLHNVLSNLMHNAWKYTAKTKHAKIEFDSQQQNGETVFYVRDNGAGFDMAYADKLFVPFQRLHKASEFPGHGVGLATVQRIIHRHGGRIWAEAQPGKGATFYFTLETDL